MTAPEPFRKPPSDAVTESIRDTLIDCMTSFDINGEAAQQAADYILSPEGGLIVTVAE